MPQRRAFTLVWVVVTIAVIATLAAFAAPALSTDAEIARTQTAVKLLKEIAHGDSAYFTSDGSYPYRVAELSGPLAKSDPTYTNSCGAGNTFASSDVTAWNNAGPYIPVYANAQTPDAIWADVGFINDTLIRNPATNKAGFHEIQINGVTTEDATMIDVDVDGVADGTTGTVRYGAAVDDTLTLTYWVPIAGKC